MKTKLTSLISIISIFTISICSIFSLPTYATGSLCDQTGVPAEVQASTGCNNTTAALPEVIVNILNAIITASGLIAVIFIIVGGVQYMTSTGDAGKVKKAKDTILYAVIGLIICVLAFAIVNFVITDIL